MSGVNDGNAYNASMAVLSIRNLPAPLHKALRIRAAKAGRSMEAEARSILAAVLVVEPQDSAAPDMQDLVAKLYPRKPSVHPSKTLLDERRKEAKHE